MEKGQKNVKKSILVRVRLVFLLGVFFAFAIAYRIIHIQYVDGDEWRAKSNSFTKKEIKATRGNIYSDDGSLLATSLPLYRLGFDPSVSRKDKKLAEIFQNGLDSLSMLLAQRFGTHTQQEYKNMLIDAHKGTKKFIYLSRGYNLTYRDQVELMKWPIFREGKNRGGVVFEKIYKRYNPFKELAYRTVGYINDDKAGAGLERSFNQLLAGTNGQATYQQLAGGIARPIFDGTEIRPVDGLDVYSTLNVNIQDVAEASLLKALTTYEAKFGCVVVMEVKTGEVKAMANLGLKDGKYTESFNYAVAQNHYPGSTFKLASYMALLEDGKISLRDTINTGNGRWTIGRQTITEAKNHAYGSLSVKDAFAKSSNIAVSKTLVKHFKARPEKFLQYITNFGLSEPLNFQLRGAERPFFRSPGDKKHWNDAALAKMSFGYESLISPLQTLAFYNAVANGGKMIQPIIVKEVRANDQVAKTFEPRVIREKICSDETIVAAREMLEAVVENPKGTAHKIQSPLYKIAGKTGTAHKFQDGHWIDNAYYTSFAGYFPADQPKYSAIVIIDSPRFGLMAGDAAAPVFRDIADKIYASDVEMHRMLAEKSSPQDVPGVAAGKFEDLHEVCNRLGVSNYNNDTLHPEWVLPGRKANRAIYWQTNRTETGSVPDVKGMPLRDALYLLENYGYRVRCNGRGRVVNQAPVPNQNIKKGETITLTLG
jgi:cell division protein FtsI (penicillin-binding protein 3)